MTLNEINIAELLKDCPKGMELYSTIYGPVYFEGVKDSGNVVLIYVKTVCNTDVVFYPDGRFNIYYPDSEMTLFPSKDVRTWEGFVPPCKFKVGDRIKWKGHDASGRIEKIEDNVYHVDYGYDDGCIRVSLNMQDDYELVPDKFDITTLKPFDKVLVRDKDKYKWFISLFSLYGGIGIYKYHCIDCNVYAQCIPYEGNEHLLGTADNCDDFYKTWE